MDEPEPKGVPPQLPLYHCQLAAVPRLPPLALNVALPPEQRLVVVVLTDVAAVELEFVLMVILEQAVVLHEPTPFTKYVVAEDGLTVMELPVPAVVPVQLPVNHCQAAPDPRLPPFTVSVAVEPAQIVEDAVVIPAGAELTELTEMVADTQPVLPQVPSALA